ncbi:MAG: carnitine 3-dehydrogenase [Paracoccaceae bacterium]
MTPGRAAIVGGGVIGGGWAARFLLNGWDVAVHDPDPQAERRIAARRDAARRGLPALYDTALPAEGRLSYHDTLASAVAGADWVQESVPERLDLKHAVLAAIAEAAPREAIVASSTSGFTPTALTAAGARAIVAHPFNPVYLLPLVELVGDPDICARAGAILGALGMHPLTVRREIDAHVADRLLEAVWRESLWLVADGVATTAEIDDAIRMGFGLRWAQMGLFETYRIAGGEGGMAHFLDQFGPALAWPWTKLTDVPAFTPELVALIAGQSDAQSGARSIRDLERRRDDNLVAMLRALKREGDAAGAVIAAHEARLASPPGEAADGAVETVRRRVPASWTDGDGRMDETHCLEIAAQASERLMVLAWADAARSTAGRPFSTAEVHLRLQGEARAGETLRVTTRVLGAEGSRTHLFHRLLCAGRPLASVEAMLVHVDPATRRSRPPPPAVAEGLARLRRAHARLDPPAEAGRRIEAPGPDPEGAASSPLA